MVLTVNRDCFPKQNELVYLCGGELIFFVRYEMDFMYYLEEIQGIYITVERRISELISDKSGSDNWIKFLSTKSTITTLL
jgi:hypothetical protein